jgi:hypothetical protein
MPAFPRVRFICSARARKPFSKVWYVVDAQFPRTAAIRIIPVPSNPIPINFGDSASIAPGKVLFNFPGQIDGTGAINAFSGLRRPVVQ